MENNKNKIIITIAIIVIIVSTLIIKKQVENINNYEYIEKEELEFEEKTSTDEKQKVENEIIKVYVCGEILNPRSSGIRKRWKDRRCN